VREPSPRTTQSALGELSGARTSRLPPPGSRIGACKIVGEPVEGAAQARVDRPVGQVEQLRDLSRGVAEQVSQDDDSTLLGRKRGERLEDAARRRPEILPAADGGLVGHDLPARRARTRPVDRAVRDDAVQPRRERPAPIEAVERPERRDEGLLRDVLAAAASCTIRYAARWAAGQCRRKSSSTASLEPPCAARTSDRSRASA
jgi:hypothetical protein